MPVYALVHNQFVERPSGMLSTTKRVIQKTIINIDMDLNDGADLKIGKIRRQINDEYWQVLKGEEKQADLDGSYLKD